MTNATQPARAAAFNPRLSRKHIYSLCGLLNAHGAGQYTCDDDPNFRKLHGLGLVSWRPSRGVSAGVGRFDITPAGRAALTPGGGRE